MVFENKQAKDYHVLRDEFRKFLKEDYLDNAQRVNQELADRIAFQDIRLESIEHTLELLVKRVNDLRGSPE